MGQGWREIRPHKIPTTGDDTPVSNVWAFVWRMTGRHQIFVCLLAVVVAALNLAPIELQRRIVNEVVETQDVPLLIQFGLAYLAIAVMFQVTKFALRLYQEWLNESTNLYIRRHLISLYSNKLTKEHDPEGRVVSIIVSEVEKLGGFVGEALSQACANIALLLGVILYMFIVEPSIALFAIGFMVPQIVLVPLMQRRLNELVEDQVGHVRSLGDAVSDMDGDETGKGPKSLMNIFDTRMKINLLKFTLKALLNLLNALGPLCVLVYGGYLVMQGETQVGVIVAFISGFERISGPVRDLVGFYRVAEQARVQHDLIAKWIDKAER